MYDIKYAPFADSYIGMAHGDTYEHVKRWLKQRFIFVDTLFDYAPSYNNDVLTIRANTTELMTLEIETYTPVYQHLSWYNGQMDKKKIDGKVSVEFSGTAQAATDQEVLIYGGSNVKSIKGITSMNPNRMLIGSATKLVEIDAHDCPLLADINANKANLSPHEYLNKVDLSNCPLLEGNLRLNNSPLVQEINIKGTNITGMNLPSSIRNLQVLRLPNTITELTLNDAGMLHTLDFDEGVALQSISMTNCNALENVINFDLLQTPSITLNNSYNTAAELYFRDTTNLSLSNMSNLERVIFTPNNEYETFELINVANAPDYKVTTFNCPKLSTFMTTAPYRESYNDCGKVQETRYIKDYDNLVDILIDKTPLNAIVDYSTGAVSDSTSGIHYTSQDYIEVIGDTEYTINITNGTSSLLNLAFYNNSIEYITGVNQTSSWSSYTFTTPSDCCYIRYHIYGSSSQFQTSELLSPSIIEEIVYKKGYGDIQPNTTFTANSIDISSTQFTDVKLLCTTDTNTLKLPTTVKNFYCDSSFDLDTDYLEDGEYDVVHGELVEPYTTDYEGEVLLNEEVPNLIPSSADGSLIFSMYAPSNTVAPASGTWDLYGLEFDNFHTFGMNNDVKQDNKGNITMPARYDDYNITIKNADISPKTHNTMLYPLLVNEDNPITGTLDYTNYAGKHLSWSFAYTDEEYVNIAQPKDELLNSYEYKYNAFYDTEYEFDNPYEIARYTSSASGVLPSFNSEFTYTYDEIDNGDGTYTTEIYADSLDNLPTRISFADKGGLVGIDKLNMSKVTDMSNMFRGQINLAYIKDVSNWDVSNVTNMTQVFYNTKKLTSLDLSGWNTSSVTDMKGMFNSCQNLTTLDVSSFDTSKVIDMNNMFNNCTGLTSLNLSGFDTSNVTSMSYMFNGCTGLTSLNLSGFDTSNVTSMANMFRWCSGLTSLDVSGFETSKVTNMANMFSGCSGLTSVNLSSFNTSNVTDMSYMFSSCSGLTSLNLSNWSLDNINTAISQLSVSPSTSTLYGTVIIDESTLPSGWTYDNVMVIAKYTANATGVLPTFNTDFTGYTTGETDNGDGTYTVSIATDSLDNLPTKISFNGIDNNVYITALVSVEKLNTSNVTVMSNMFRNCKALTSVNLTGLDTSKTTNMVEMFKDCNVLLEIKGIENWDTSSVTDIRYMFQNCSSLTELDVSGFDTANVTRMEYIFNGCSNLTSLDVSGFNTSKVTQMNHMFSGCNNLTSLDVSGFDTSKVTTMEGMFGACTNLIELNLQGWKVRNINFMFNNCTNLQKVDTTNWDTTELTNIGHNDYQYSGLFYLCSSLTEIIGIENWNTSKVTNMGATFKACSSLITLDLSNWDTSNVTKLDGMFDGCTKLTSLDVSGFHTSNVTTMKKMFNGCQSLTSLDLSAFDTSNMTDMQYMFSGCAALIELVGLSDWDTSAVTNISRAFQSTPLTSLDLGGWVLTNCTAAINAWSFMYDLESIVFPSNLSVSFSIGQSFNLTADNVVEIFNKLVTVTTTQTATIGTNLLNKLTEEQIAIATNKGWTVA